MQQQREAKGKGVMNELEGMPHHTELFFIMKIIAKNILLL